MALSKGGSLKDEGFGDGLLMSIEHRDEEILEIPFHSAYHILHIFKIRQLGCALHTSRKNIFYRR